MNIIRTIPNRKKAKLKSIASLSENTILTIESNATTTIVGISTQLRSRGFLSAINNKIPQHSAPADMRPIGYTISANPILSGINTEIAI